MLCDSLIPQELKNKKKAPSTCNQAFVPPLGIAATLFTDTAFPDRIDLLVTCFSTSPPSANCCEPTLSTSSPCWTPCGDLCCACASATLGSSYGCVAPSFKAFAARISFSTSAVVDDTEESWSSYSSFVDVRCDGVGCCACLSMTDVVVSPQVFALSPRKDVSLRQSLRVRECTIRKACDRMVKIEKEQWF